MEKYLKMQIEKILNSELPIEEQINLIKLVCEDVRLALIVDNKVH